MPGRDSYPKLPFCHSLALIELPLAEGGLQCQTIVLR